DRPEQWVDRWDYKNIFRMTFHYEATYDVRRTIEKIRSRQKQVGVALKLGTPVNVLYDILQDIDMVLLLAVEPGRQGQEFDPRVIEKIKELRQSHPMAKIGVDGGVTPLLASSLVAAGANILVSGSYIFSQDNIEDALKSLQVE
ncbi:MAG: ribulose-phosphate 3-epimerase, partial [Candidatus Komeilibacteria bacterium]|nr:ribulose-phosphate 3-epimerase [Candidatus Komeilibacteria bacterium]